MTGDMEMDPVSPVTFVSNDHVNAMRDAALWYVDQSLVPIPLNRGEKSPLGQKWQDRDEGNWARQPADVDRIWLNDHPGSGIGLMCGLATRTFIVDVDVKNGANGVKSMNAFVEHWGPLPSTLRNVSVSGGYHLIYRVPTEWKPALEHQKRYDIDGMQILMDGHQAVMAPTLLSDGRRYELFKDGTGGRPRQVVDIDPELLDAFLYGKRLDAGEERTDDWSKAHGGGFTGDREEAANTIIALFSRMPTDAFGASIVKAICDEMAACPEGARYNTLKRLAKRLTLAIARDGAVIKMDEAIAELYKAYHTAQARSGDWGPLESSNFQDTIEWVVTLDEFREHTERHLAAMRWLTERGLDPESIKVEGVSLLDELDADAAEWDEPRRVKPTKVKHRMKLRGGGRSAADKAKNADNP